MGLPKTILLITGIPAAIAFFYLLIAGLINYKTTKQKCYIAIVLGDILAAASFILPGLDVFKGIRRNKLEFAILFIIDMLVGLIGLILLFKGFNTARRQLPSKLKEQFR